MGCPLSIRLHRAADPARYGAMNTALPRGTSKADRPPAVLVGVQLQGVSDEALASSLTELERLAATLGLKVIGRLTQKRRGLDSSNVLGAGKLEELAQFTGGSGFVPSFKRPGSRTALEETSVDDEAESDGAEDRDGDDEDANESDSPREQAVTVLVDQDLTPTQVRNLEAATGVEVLDRSMVILSIFQRHARSREAKIQVEIARLNYMAPRLREAGADTERQRGGVGGKGAGETSLELGRRATRDRIAELRRSLVAVEREANTQRSRRTTGATHTVALVGYTNAGKSRLMRGLTHDVIYIADQLFATLDTTVRVLMPETRPRILISDTVGFIKDLPHDLVASFRSTLEEAKDANLLLHVLDASDPAFRDQYQVTRQVLGEIGAADNARLLILNKCDLLSEDERAALASEFPEAVLMSAHVPDDIAALHNRIQAFYESSMEDEDFVISYDRQAHVAMLHERCRVLEERYEEDGAHLRVRAPEAVLGRLRREFEAALDDET